MTDATRIDWPNALVRGGRFTPVILIAGVPRILTASGVHPTVAASSGLIDPAWWPGVGSLAQPLPGAITFDPVREWLDAGHVFEIYEEARIVEGDVRVEALTFDVYDVRGQSTADLSIREGRFTQLLAAEIGPSDLTIPLVSASGIPSSGIACIGRETLIYDGTGGNNLALTSPPTQRGAYGSPARRHTVPRAHPPLVAFAGPRHWQGRRAVLFVCKLSADGLTLTDPTPMYIGTVGAGVQRVRGGTRWSIPLDPISESYTRKWSPRTVDLYGVAHFYTDETQPLQIGWLADTYLGAASGSPDNGGWHTDWADFERMMQVRAAVTEPTSLYIRSDPHLTLRLAGGSSPTLLTVVAAWHQPPYIAQNIDTTDTFRFSQDPPNVCLHMNGRVRIGQAADFDKIPSTLSWSVSTPVPGVAYLALAADTDHYPQNPLFARVLERDAVHREITVAPLFAPGIGRDATRSGERQQLALITKRTSATIGVIATGETPLGALRALAGALEEIAGLDLQDDSIDWDWIQRQFNGFPFPLNDRREYRIAEGDTLLGLLVQEFRLRGMSMGIRYGRIACYRPASFASTEPVRCTIVKTDVLVDKDGGQLAEWDVVDNTQPLASSVEFELPDGTTYTNVDDTFCDEFGDGTSVKCTALKHLPPESDLSGVRTALEAVSTQLLGPLAEPSRLVRLPLPPTFLHLQPGDLVKLTHDMVPTWRGTIGVTEAPCQVTEVRRQVFGGSARAIVGLRLQSEDLAGYAPEALVAAGGLNHGSHVVTLDVASGFGASCFARAIDVDGNAVTDPLDAFAIGHVVVLSEADSESPIADEQFALTAIDTVAHTVTLNGFPSATMAALCATAAYKVILRFAPWTAVNADQQRYAFIADASTGLFSDSAAPKRWAA